ncbi:MAG TPA: peptide ABC transporter substrate-binding protein [Chloroflexi bacterium]|jgi:peptide/nickel transport system substrate-binding protein|nr:peptide ABC transporter substrate-binding protein [Chloroflexota bacterium]
MGRIRLQVMITLLAILVLVGAVGYLAFSVTTVVVPDYGGTYVEGIAGNPQAINPILAQQNPVDRDLVALIFNGLTRVGAQGTIMPDLAEDWDISADGTTYTFYLRQDVLWHDGAPFTANDVVYTINAMQNPNYPGSPALAELWRSVVVEQLDTYTVRFLLREPYAPFLDYTTIGILPVHILGSVPVEALGDSQFNAKPIGTGPFMVAEVSARHIALQANPEYFRSRPYLDRIEFIYYPNDQAVFEARKRGEVAGIARVLPEHLQAVRDDPDLTLYSAPLSGYTLIFLNLDRGVFQDPAVRRAMALALDRQQLVDDILGGQGIVIHSPILPDSWAYDENVRQYTHDPRKAVVALEEAGWFDDNGDGVRERGSQVLAFTLATNDDPTRVRLIHAVSEQLAKVGIRATPEVVGWDELTTEMLPTRRFDAVLSEWQGLPPDPDPYPFWHSSQAMEGGWNVASYISEQADLLLQDARTTNVRDQRIELYRRFQELFSEDMPSLLLYQPVYNYALDKNVQGVQVAPMIDGSQRFSTVSSWYIATQRMLFSEARNERSDVRPR